MPHNRPMPRPAQPLLSYSSIVATALAIIDADGLDAFSLKRLAQEMNVQAPSLYHHFPDKASILEAVAQAIVRETPAAAPPRPRGLDRVLRHPEPELPSHDPAARQRGTGPAAVHAT